MEVILDSLRSLCRGSSSSSSSSSSSILVLFSLTAHIISFFFFFFFLLLIFSFCSNVRKKYMSCADIRGSECS